MGFPFVLNTWTNMKHTAAAAAAARIPTVYSRHYVGGSRVGTVEDEVVEVIRADIKTKDPHQELRRRAKERMRSSGWRHQLRKRAVR